MKTHRLLGAVLASLVVLFALTGCETVPKNVPEGLSQAELFQRAQEAADKSNWNAALVYYQTFLDRYPDDLQNVASARYEIAFIHYRLDKLKVSQQEFNDLLAMYSGPNADKLPQWPKVLATDILKKIDAKLNPTTS